MMSPHPGGPDLSSFVRPHAQRIVRLTGQEFSPAYLEGLTANPAAVFDSEPPTTALLAAAELGRETGFLRHLQRVHFVGGADICNPQELLRQATAFGFDPAAFAAAVDRLTGEPTRRHIQTSRALLARVGGSGFPTYAYETAQGCSMLNSSAFLGKPEQWAEALASLP
jgi:putative protein-disulfide isomerase